MWVLVLRHGMTIPDVHKLCSWSIFVYSCHFFFWYGCLGLLVRSFMACNHDLMKVCKNLGWNGVWGSVSFWLGNISSEFTMAPR